LGAVDPAVLKGCQSQGDTLEEAIADIKEGIELYLARGAA
jgi:predicted RNase H-like HicB family nuclease